MNCRIARINRLKKRKDFRRLFEEGTFASNAFIAVHLFPNPENRRRIGFSAGKKLGCAVIRNRCKRRLRECYRINQAVVPLNMDMVIVARRAMVQATWDKVVKAFLDVTRRSLQIAKKKRGE